MCHAGPGARLWPRSPRQAPQGWLLTRCAAKVRAAARPTALGHALHAAPRSGKALGRRGRVSHTTEASPDTEATLLSSAQGCRFCSAKSDELCRQSGSGGSGGRSGRGSASCCRCRSSRPARCRSASRSSAVWRLGGRRRGVSGAGPRPPHSSLPLGPARSPSPPRASPPFGPARGPSPPLGAPVLEPRLDLSVGHAQGLGQRRPLS